MTCDDYAKACIDQLDAIRGPARGPARPAPRADLEAHAANCPSCRASGARWEVLARAIAACGPPPVADAVAVDRLLARLAAGPDRRSVIGASVWMMAAAAAVLALAVGLAVRRPEPAGPPPIVAADRPLADTLAAATESTWSLARAAAAPAARVGLEMLASAEEPAPDGLQAPEPDGWAWPVRLAPPAEILESMGDRANAGSGPLAGSARSAFGFLLVPGLDGRTSPPKPPGEA